MVDRIFNDTPSEPRAEFHGSLAAFCSTEVDALEMTEAGKTFGFWVVLDRKRNRLFVQTWSILDDLMNVAM